MAPIADACGSPFSKSTMNGIDATPLREVLLLVDVHLDELHAVLVGDPVENR
jgi:hypothetical protein